MRKWILIGTASICLLVWSAVIAVYLLSPPPIFEANNHSLAATSHSLLKVEQTSEHVQEEDKKERLSQSKTIIETEDFSKPWIIDIEKDGKLSIDTLLETLDIEE
ncbi:hypothetical protein [Halobacillus sp. K22]|uniref:hypothetical protein n=1 Tax=Halobacillus sp. K22 TaxID=3457431 RepID=UPI003FCDC441